MHLMKSCGIRLGIYRYFFGSVVVDRHRFDADLDPNFHVDADPDTDWHQNDVNSQADPTPSFTHVGTWKIR
jgi:hypothetical protein